MERPTLGIIIFTVYSPPPNILQGIWSPPVVSTNTITVSTHIWSTYTMAQNLARNIPLVKVRGPLKPAAETVRRGVHSRLWSVRTSHLIDTKRPWRERAFLYFNLAEAIVTLYPQWMGIYDVCMSDCGDELGVRHVPSLARILASGSLPFPSNNGG